MRADTSAQKMGFKPTALHEVLLGRRSEFKNDLRVGQGLAAARRTSFLFAETLAAVLQKGAGKTTESPNDCNELLQWLRRLEQYGRSELFVLESPGSYRSQRNTLPLCLAEDADEKRSGGGGCLALPLEAPFAVIPTRMAAVRKAIEALNRVLEQWVPGLAVGAASLGRALGVNGEIVERAQLVSYKNGREIPLALESGGIKEMLAVLPLLIEVYNCRSLTVAADDLDAGLFEYLFGELLQIFSQGGRGGCDDRGSVEPFCASEDAGTRGKSAGCLLPTVDFGYRRIVEFGSSVRSWPDHFGDAGSGADSNVGRLQQKEQGMRRSAAAGLIRSVGTADAYFAVPTVQQHVALLVNCNSPGGSKRCLLRGVKRGDTTVPFAAYGPLVVPPRNDMLIFLHGNLASSVIKRLNYNGKKCRKKCDIIIGGYRRA